MTTNDFHGLDVGWMQAQYRDCRDKREQLEIFGDLTGAKRAEILEVLGASAPVTPLNRRAPWTAEEEEKIIEMVEDGRTMEVWEMDVFTRIFYLEFWQPNMTLCEAGCDAMLRLWELNGGTMFETLSHINENGSYAFSTYPGMWSEEYDPDGLAWCRDYCEKRFSEGPVWAAQYFRKGQYHDWGKWTPIPAYEIDGIYFSVARWQ